MVTMYYRKSPRFMAYLKPFLLHCVMFPVIRTWSTK